MQWYASFWCRFWIASWFVGWHRLCINHRQLCVQLAGPQTLGWMLTTVISLYLDANITEPLLWFPLYQWSVIPFSFYYHTRGVCFYFASSLSYFLPAVVYSGLEMHETKWKHSPRWWRGVVVKKEKRKPSPFLTQSVLCGGKRLLIDTYRNACAMFALVLLLLLRCFPFVSALVGIWHNAIFDVSNTISWKSSFCLTVLYILFSECLKTICREHIKRKHHKTPAISPFQCRFTTNSRRKTLASLRIVFFRRNYVIRGKNPSCRYAYATTASHHGNRNTSGRERKDQKRIIILNPKLLQGTSAFCFVCW